MSDQPRSILHVDMDAFFASAEMLDDPSLVGKPVLVGGRGRRAVVAAASYEAREFGCHSAQPMAVALRRCPQAVVVAPRRERYVALSRQVFEIFEAFTPQVEGLSIDEAFLDVSGTERLHGSAVEVATQIRARVRDETGLTCSIGVAANKFVAKIASDQNKPDGLTVVEPGMERGFLAPLPIRALWGVGPKTAESLRGLGITRVGEIAAVGEPAMTKALGEHGRHLFALSVGRDQRPVEPGRERKQISHEDTFERDLVGTEAIRSSLLHQATHVADRLVRTGVKGRTITIKIRDTGFRTEIRQCTVETPTHQAREIYRRACDLLESLDIEGRRFRLTGVGVGSLVSTDLDAPVGAQLSLLDGADEDGSTYARDVALQGVMTKLRDRFGSHALFPAGARRDRGDDD